MKRLIPLLFLFVSSPAQYSYMSVSNPQQSWRWDYATIEDATISVHPKGAYSQVNMYLDVSARLSTYTGFNSSDTLEISYSFDLPAGSMVTDLWLWVDGKIMRGYMLDRWTASNIYENIVKRRRDPALLIKEYGDRYTLKIYPLTYPGSRKVRISFLAPNTLEHSTSVLTLPLQLLRPGRTFARDLSVLFFPENVDRTATMPSVTGVTMVSKTDSVEGPYQEFVIPPASLSGSASLRFATPIRSGVSARTYTGSGDGIYQIAVTPSKVFGLSFARRVTILVDFQADRSVFTVAQLRTALRSALHGGLTPADTFCLLIGNVFGPLPVGGGWFAADPAGIDAAMDSLKPSFITGTSNLPVLLHAGVDSAGRFPEESVVWLVGGSSDHGNYATANQLMTQLLALPYGRIPIHVANISNLNTLSWWFNGRSWVGNEYLYDNLTRLTGGTYRFCESTSDLTTGLTASLESTAGIIESFDLTTTISSGIVYGRISPGDVPLRSVGVNTPILQLGRFSGTLPLQIDVAGRFRGNIVSQRISIPVDSVLPGDLSDLQLWSGLTISALEAQTVSNAIVNQVIAMSTASRVLSKYTALLALEPGDTVLPCLTCTDETRLTKVEEIAETPVDSVLKAYPNPFNSQTTLRVTFPRGVRPDEASFRIYNILGQEVHVFDVSTLREGEARTFSWNGLSASGTPVATGVYLAVFQTPKHRHTVKLLMVK